MPKGVYLRTSIMKTGKYVRTVSSRKKSSESKKGNMYCLGRKLSEDTKNKIGKKSKGRLLSKESKKKLSEALKGRIPWNKGKSLSEEHKEKIKQKALRGDENPSRRPEVLEKLSGRNNHMFGKLHSPNTIKRMREVKIGEKNPMWNNGSSFIPYSTDFTCNLKQFIRDRDNNKCQNPYCEGKTKKLAIHHINYDKKDCSQLNLITLCNSCNGKANSNRLEREKFYKKIVLNKLEYNI